MTTAQLEHANYTVTDPQKTAAWMCDLFGWKVRWSGEAKNGGFTVHVGSAAQYLALYAPPTPQPSEGDGYSRIKSLNHIGLVVDDLDAMERAVSAMGFEPTNHGDYEPGRRFYFEDRDGIEYEVVQYS